MSTTSPRPVDCGRYADDLALLALGTLAGRPRAEILDHIERCAECAAELEGLSAGADALLLLAPEATPPAGFDRRTIASMTGGGERRRSIPTRLAALAAAALFALGVGIGIGAIVTRAPTHDPSFASAPLTSPSGASGTVVLSLGGRAWMFMTLDDVQANGPIACTVTLKNGVRETVGHFRMESGYGAWAVWLSVPASAVSHVAIVDGAGVTLASARLTA
jgi:hypothetical protein